MHYDSRMNQLHTAVTGQELDGFAHIRNPALVDRSNETRDHAYAHIFVLKLLAEELVRAGQMDCGYALDVSHYLGKMYHWASQSPVPENVSRLDVRGPGEWV